MKSAGSRIILAFLWLAVTAAVAILVARTAGSNDGTDITAPAPPITAEDRSAVALTERTIAPVASGEGTVMRDQRDGLWLLVTVATCVGSIPPSSMSGFGVPTHHPE